MLRAQGAARRDGFLTRWALWLEHKLENYRLLDIPRKCWWTIYRLCAYGHLACSCLLIVLSISCFCTGIQNSFMYDEINCADGTSLAAPMVNTFVIYYALMALKQQGNYWAAFEHVVMSSTAFFLNTFFAIDELLMGLRWVNKTPRTVQRWPLHFAVLDFLMFGLLTVMNIASVGIASIYVFLLTDWLGWRERARRSVERAQQREHDA
ncbi:hypothetical protein M3Y94_00845600 [Aphelenchoides besseyi]|nr:hypothetical protein M3Y94_00845600 [Aphelenchoides besseyi]